MAIRDEDNARLQQEIKVLFSFLLKEDPLNFKSVPTADISYTASGGLPFVSVSSEFNGVVAQVFDQLKSIWW